MKERSKSYKFPFRRDRFLRILFCCLLAVFSVCLSPLGAQIGNAVTLSWQPSTGDVAGYKVYSGTSSGVYSTTYDAGKFTTLSVSGLTAGKTYYFVAKAYGSTGLLSGPSNQVSYTQPTSTTTPTTPTTPVATYGITTKVMSNATAGTITPSSYVTVASGGSVTIYMTPKAGHRVYSVTVDGYVVGSPTSYRFTNVTRNHTVAVWFL